MVRTAPLHQTNQTMDAELRICFNEKMDMIRHDFQFNDFRLTFFRDFAKDHFQAFIHTVNEYAPTIFWTPHNMVFA